MYCENCGKNYANIRYTQIINGDKKEMFLCEECGKILGLENFNMQMDFSTFLSDFLSEFREGEILPGILKQQETRCKRCNSTYEDFIKTGKFGCPECYETYEEKIDPFLKRSQGANRHIGRIGRIEENMKKNNEGWEESEREKIKDSAKLGQIYELNRQLKIAIKEEKYEEAAILRDKIKEIEGEI